MNMTAAEVQGAQIRCQEKNTRRGGSRLHRYTKDICEGGTEERGRGCKKEKKKDQGQEERKAESSGRGKCRECGRGCGSRSQRYRISRAEYGTSARAAPTTTRQWSFAIPSSTTAMTTIMSSFAVKIRSLPDRSKPATTGVTVSDLPFVASSTDPLHEHRSAVSVAIPFSFK
ncbi:hypothetical protein CONLIGDRAFT_225188 [Coniochaeta ligniaria NRRL 30616]|uniref:Uncharacterized protein n=1 Tax=Coniochaeta ligniaria NRRL 30616 TaxID=1408157 RepID=A0A1J7IMG4_9PEZI|nr:hypothetical protein CONLIGDRAFT_225188 [Coniochaeta ligniaria NRRL 30616]